MKNDFSFVMPARIFKSDDGEYKIAGLASTENIDKQGEVIIQKGIDLSPIDQQKGFFNYDHSNKPEDIIGVVDSYSRGDKGLYVQGKLFKGHKRAEAVYAIMKGLSESKSGAIGFSVEGQILERDPNNPKIIRKCKIKNIAITLNPVNSDTYAGLIKSLNVQDDNLIKSILDSDIEFAATKENIANYKVASESIQATFSAEQVVAIVQKALGMSAEGSYSKAPNELTNGDAMATSDMKPGKKKKKEENQAPAQANGLAKALKPMTNDLYKSLMLKMMDKLQKLHPDISRVDIWEAVSDRMHTTFPDIYSAEEEQ